MRTLARLACLAPAVAVLLTACSAPPSSTPPAATAPASTAAGAPSTTVVASPDPATTARTGTQLKAALSSDMPTGFSLSDSGTMDTGADLQDEQDGPMKGSSHCADLGATAWIQVSGMSGVSFAQSDYLDGRNQEIAQEIDSFDSPEHAGRAFSQLKAFMKQCGTFRDPNATSITYRLEVSSLPGLGDAAVKGVITSSRVEGGVVEVAALNGNDVITVLYSATKLSRAQHATDIATTILHHLSA
jgi:hypothetical protein